MNTKLIVRVTFFFTIWIVMFLSNPLMYACTGFMMSDGENVLVGNNEDYKIPYTRVWFLPSEYGRYGRVFFGYDNWSPQGGMNDQGLFIDGFMTKKQPIKLSTDKPKFPGPMIDTIMAKCANVEDVLDMFSKYNLEWMEKAQVFIVDKSGDSAIIEGDEVVRKSGSYQVVTNFRQSQIPENQKPCNWWTYGCSRYKTTEKMLLAIDTPTVAQFRDILKATHRSSYNIISTTQYSNIYDLSNGVVYLYYLHDFENEIAFNLNQELKKGQHYFDIPSLFNKELKYETQVYTHSSPSFRIYYPKHYKVIEPNRNEVLLVKNPMSNTPQIGVYVENQPKDIQLKDVGEKYLFDLLEKSSTKAILLYSTQTSLSDGTPANETLFERVINEHWPFKTLVLSTYHDGKLIFVATTSFAHPEALRDYLYNLRFD